MFNKAIKTIFLGALLTWTSICVAGAETPALRGSSDGGDGGYHRGLTALTILSSGQPFYLRNKRWGNYIKTDGEGDVGLVPNTYGQSMKWVAEHLGDGIWAFKSHKWETYLSGRDDGVVKNIDELLSRAEWTVVDHGDGLISLQSVKHGTYLRGKDDETLTMASGVNSRERWYITAEGEAFNDAMNLPNYSRNTVDTPDLPAGLVRRAKVAAGLSMGIYFGLAIDTDRTNTGSYKSKKVLQYFSEEMTEFEAAGVFRKERTCYAVFKGKNYQEPEWYEVLLDGFQLEKASAIAQDTRSSGYIAVEKESGFGSCEMNKFLVKGLMLEEDYRNDVMNEIEDCMNTCGDDCDIVYAGHSAGGAQAMAAALYLKDTERFNARDVSIITFGQPGTFKGGDCGDLQSLEDQMYRFVNYKDFDGGDGVTMDPAPSIGGKLMGHTIFLSNDSERVKMHHYDNDPGYGASVATFSATSSRDKARLRAHSAFRYMDRIQRFPSGVGVPTFGFGEGSRCRSTEDCIPTLYCHPSSVVESDANDCRPI